MTPYAIGAAVAAVGVIAGLFGIVVAARGKDTRVGVPDPDVTGAGQLVRES